MGETLAAGGAAAPRKGGKGLHVNLPANAVEGFVRRFGARGVYILTSVKSERESRELMASAKRVS
jgi:hypothetical protein